MPLLFAECVSGVVDWSAGDKAKIEPPNNSQFDRAAEACDPGLPVANGPITIKVGNEPYRLGVQQGGVACRRVVVTPDRQLSRYQREQRPATREIDATTCSKHLN